MENLDFSFHSQTLVPKLTFQYAANFARTEQALRPKGKNVRPSSLEDIEERSIPSAFKAVRQFTGHKVIGATRILVAPFTSILALRFLTTLNPSTQNLCIRLGYDTDWRPSICWVAR